MQIRGLQACIRVLAEPVSGRVRSGATADLKGSAILSVASGHGPCHIATVVVSRYLAVNRNAACFCSFSASMAGQQIGNTLWWHGGAQIV